MGSELDVCIKLPAHPEIPPYKSIVARLKYRLLKVVLTLSSQ